MEFRRRKTAAVAIKLLLMLIPLGESFFVDYSQIAESAQGRPEGRKSLAARFGRLLFPSAVDI